MTGARPARRAQNPRPLPVALPAQPDIHPEHGRDVSPCRKRVAQRASVSGMLDGEPQIPQGLPQRYEHARQMAFDDLLARGQQQGAAGFGNGGSRVGAPLLPAASGGQ